ncbi:MAG: glycosyltransferase family 39 protein, partial [Candidatus Omnitrophica bacterium]|nr:glycosyltransferase family 39 protein [Candidatus Omnitrophota bacterium]
PGFFILTSMILVTIFTSCLFSSLLLVLIYKISRYFTKNEKHRMLLVIIAGLCSPIFPTALSMFMHQVGTFFIFLSFYLLFKIKQEKLEDNKYFVFAGLSLGFSIASDFYSFFIVPILVFYIFLLTMFKNKQKFFIFLFGCLVGLSPFLFYNFSILGFHLELLSKYNDRSIYTTVSEATFNNYGFVTPRIEVLYQILIGSYRGLFFYYPILLLSLIGVFYMYKKFKMESGIILLIFIFNVIVVSSRVTWHGGYGFGLKYLLLSTPFLIIPLLFEFKDFESLPIKTIITILILISLITNLSGLQLLEDFIIDRKTLMIADMYQKDVSNLNLLNPLQNYYFPLLLKYGPRSLIFENLFEKHVDIDIRDIPLSRDWKPPYNGGTNHIPFLSFILILIIMGLLWSSELYESIKR